MAIDEKAMWDRKYSEGSHRSLDPDPFLVKAYEEFLSGQSAGSALDVAGGVGRHALWLAARGWKVRLLDISEVGIGLAKQHAARALAEDAGESPVTSDVTSEVTSKVTAEAVDLNRVRDLGHEQYDLVLVFFYLQRELFPALVSALKPGGWLIYKTYTTEQQRFSGANAKSGQKTGPSHPMFLLEPNELLRAFSSLRILHYHETVTEKGVAELAGRK